MLRLSDNIIIYGNTDMINVVQKSDNDCVRYSQKLSLIGSELKYRFVRDNIGEYWLTRIYTPSQKSLTLTIPGFVHGILSYKKDLTPWEVQYFLSNQVIDKPEKRFDISKFNMQHPAEIAFQSKKFIQFQNTQEDLTIIGPNRPLLGNVRYLLYSVFARNIQFKNFDIQKISSLDCMFYGCSAQQIDLTGIKFGKISRAVWAFKNSDIDRLTGVDNAPEIIQKLRGIK